MTDLSYQELAHTQFNHALTLFRDAYAPYVLARMQEYFGKNLRTHLHALAADGAIFLDYDSHKNIAFDVNAILYLLTEDGGLRQPEPSYEPKLFWCVNRAMATKDLPGVLLVPSESSLLNLRDTRNKWAHQRNVPIREYREKTSIIIDCIKRLPEPFHTKLKIMQLQFIMAQFQVYQTQSEITKHIESQQQHAQALQSTTLQDIQQKIDTVVPQLDSVVSTITDQKIPQLYDQITQIQQDQAVLLTGIFGALSDTKQETSAQIATLHADIQKLHEANNIRDMAMQQLGTVHESVMLHDAHIAELTQQLSGLNHQLTGMHQQLFDAHQQIAALQRVHADIAQQLADHLRHANVVPPHHHDTPPAVPARHPWRWLVVVLLLIGVVGALIWLGYVPVMK
ncbi:MAG: hypothetical protein EBS29_06770 [Chloroflexia bacterium]|nr:hypothetical protein [Chloroflexia bacterium]